MTSSEGRVIRAAIALSEAGQGSLDAGRLPSAAIHEIYDAVREFQAQLGATGKFPNRKIAPSDQGELRLMVSHDEQLVRLDFGTPTAWFAMPKSQALSFAFAILDHCGVKIEMQHVPGTPTNPV